MTGRPKLLDLFLLVLRRHRLFESNVWLDPLECECLVYKDRGYRVGGAYGGGSSDREHARFVRRGGYTPGKQVRAELIGADWMSLAGLSQAIPPAYTEYLGTQLLDHMPRSGLDRGTLFDITLWQASRIVVTNQQWRAGVSE